MEPTDVRHFRKTAPKHPPGQMYRRSGPGCLGVLHANNVVHTDVNPSNVLFPDSTSSQEIQEFLDDSSPATSGDHTSGTIPLFGLSCILSGLMDFGHAQLGDQNIPNGIISACALQPPEVILGARIDAKVDIWAIGCMTFELPTGRDEFLAQCANRDDYFDHSGELLRASDTSPISLEQALTTHGLPASEIPLAAAFLRECLHINPTVRASAGDLVIHEWLVTAYMCCGLEHSPGVKLWSRNRYLYETQEFS